jgi:hypothetical protein
MCVELWDENEDEFISESSRWDLLIKLKKGN